MIIRSQPRQSQAGRKIAVEQVESSCQKRWTMFPSPRDLGSSHIPETSDLSLYLGWDTFIHICQCANRRQPKCSISPACPQCHEFLMVPNQSAQHLHRDF